MIRIIENQVRNDQIQILTAETQMGLGEIRGAARIFPEVHTFFSYTNKNRLYSDVGEKSLLFWKPTFGCEEK